MITSRAIEAFRAIILTGGVSAAAEMLHISQPAVTRLIKDLEASLGFSLFHRRKSRVFPTNEALTFYEEVARSFIGLERISRVAEQIRERKAGRLSIATMPALIHGLLPSVIKHFTADRPDVVTSIQVGRSPSVLQLVGSQQADIGIASSPIQGPGVKLLKTFTTDCVCILPPGHDLGKQAEISVGDLADLPFISLGQETLNRFKVDAMFENAGVKRKVQIETLLSSAAASFVMEGIGVSVVDPFAGNMVKNLGGIVRPFKPTVTFEFGVVISQSKTLSGLEQDFLEAFEHVLSEE